MVATLTAKAYIFEQWWLLLIRQPVLTFQTFEVSYGINLCTEEKNTAVKCEFSLKHGSGPWIKFITNIYHKYPLRKFFFFSILTILDTSEAVLQRLFLDRCRKCKIRPEWCIVCGLNIYHFHKESHIQRLIRVLHFVGLGSSGRIRKNFCKPVPSWIVHRSYCCRLRMAFLIAIFLIEIPNFVEM